MCVHHGAPAEALVRGLRRARPQLREGLRSARYMVMIILTVICLYYYY